MKFGMNLLLWTDTMKDEMLPIVQELKSTGYDGVEMPIFDLDPRKFAEWGKRLDDIGLERTAVTVRSSADNPMSPDAAVRALGVEKNKRVIDCCHAANAKMLVGPYHSALGEFSGKGPTADQWKWAADSMRQVAEHAGKAGVMLGLEYLNRFECYLITCVADTVRFVKDVNHPNCRMMYDTFHAHIEEKNIPDAIRSCREYCMHVHISENDRSTPGMGNVRWKENFDTLKEIGYDGWFMVEAFGLALPALVAATKIWRRMYKSETQLARDALAFMKREWGKRA
jgi:D-psicose/D-tagatose/L-ribulose 3-epimerase